jgi:hypothetical protein
LPAGTIIIGGAGIADGGMIGAAVALLAPGANSCEVCAATSPAGIATSSASAAAHAAGLRATANVTGCRAPMPAPFFILNRGDFKPAAGLQFVAEAVLC